MKHLVEIYKNEDILGGNITTMTSDERKKNIEDKDTVGWIIFKVVMVGIILYLIWIS